MNEWMVLRSFNDTK